MIDQLFAVFDVKMRLFMAPFVGRNVDSALRQFSDMCNNPNGLMVRHPEDYVLYEIGTFDVEKGVVSAIVPHAVGKALDFVKQEESASTISH